MGLTIALEHGHALLVVDTEQYVLAGLHASAGRVAGLIQVTPSIAVSVELHPAVEVALLLDGHVDSIAVDPPAPALNRLVLNLMETHARAQLTPGTARHMFLQWSRATVG